MNESIYVPGVWHCAKCGFTLVQSNLNAVDGSVTARDDPGDKCTNCDVPLWRVTWKQHADELAERCEAAIIEAAGLRTKAAIIPELFTAIRRCDGSPELLSIIGSYGDTLDDKEVLQLLKDWNETGKILHQSQ